MLRFRLGEDVACNGLSVFGFLPTIRDAKQRLAKFLIYLLVFKDV